MTLLQYSAYRLSVRNRVDGTVSAIHAAGPLSHQYMVDLFSRIEGDRLNYQKNNQDLLHADTHRGVVDAVERGDAAENTGRGVLLSSGFNGSRRFHDANYHDSMAVVTKFVFIKN